MQARGPEFGFPVSMQKMGMTGALVTLKVGGEGKRHEAETGGSQGLTLSLSNKSVSSRFSEETLNKQGGQQ